MMWPAVQQCCRRCQWRCEPSSQDNASIVTLAGNVAAARGGKGGVGLAFAVNDIQDSVKATIDSSTVSAGGGLSVLAEFAEPVTLPAGLDTQIAAMAVSGGIAQDVAGAGSVTLNWMRNSVIAEIVDIADVLPNADEITVGGQLSVEARDTSTINSVAGAITVAGYGSEKASGAIGASVSYNYLGGDPSNLSDTTNNVIRGAIENVGTVDRITIDANTRHN